MLCIQETKVAKFDVSMIYDIMGTDFEYFYLPADGVSGGVLVAWRRDVWIGTAPCARCFSVTVRLADANPWCLSSVYGPTMQVDKEPFLLELVEISDVVQDAWLVCGNFNMIYQAQDKNNARLHRGNMCCFRHMLDDLQLLEINLSGRLYTWGNQCSRPTPERIDRAFTSIDWIQSYPHHFMRALPSDCSDHAPLLLTLNVQPWAKPRFRFDTIWAKFDGFLDVVKGPWATPALAVDACRALDIKLRATTTTLKSWSSNQVGNIRLQLAAASVVILELDVAKEHRPLSAAEIELRRELKLATLGLASMQRTICRQRSWIRFLADGDANTRFFHLQACHRKRKSYIPSIRHGDRVFSDDEAKSGAIFDYYKSILGLPFSRSHRINLNNLLLLSLDLSDQDIRFTMEEVAMIIRESPSDRAPGPDSFSSLFFRLSWDIIKPDLLRVFDALWAQDWRNF